MGRLDRARPAVHIALLVETAVKGKHFLLGPGPQNKIDTFEITLAQHTRVLAIGEAGVLRTAYRKASDHTATGDDIDHRHLFRDACGRVIERDRVAENADRGVARAACERRGDKIRRWHEAIAIGVMLVDANRVKADLGRIFQLVNEVVVHQMPACRLEQLGVDVNPYRVIGLAEILRQLGIGHQVEPHQFHVSCPQQLLFCSYYRSPLTSNPLPLNSAMRPAS